MHSELEFPLLEYQVLLGCLEKEWEHPQKVQIGVRLQFPQPPQAVESDQLCDTVCYAEISAKLAVVCQSKPFHLIEHLAGCCLQAIVEDISSQIEVEVEVRKIHPPAPHFTGPAIFRLRSSTR